MKKTKIFAAFFAALLLAFVLVLAGCSQTPGVTSITLTSSDDKQSVYTIYYSDGSSQTLTVQNGQDVTVDELYAKYKELYGEELSYDEFLQKYLVLSVDNSTVIGKALQSSVKLYTEFVENVSVSTGPFGFSTVKETVQYTGSGVLYKMDEDSTYIITNYHVIYSNKSNTSANGGTKTARRIVCFLYGSENQSDPSPYKDSDGYTAYDYGEYAIECELVGGSISKDIAIVKANTKDVLAVNPNAQTASFAEEYHVGETAIAIGNPENEGISVTQGIVSVDSEEIALQIDSTARSYRSLRIDTAIYGGSSGGGLFNLKGELIGITNAGDPSDENINYAIPLQIAKGTADNILYFYLDGNEQTTGAYNVSLGVSVTSQNSRYTYDASAGYGKITEEIVVAEVSSGSIASELGLQQNDRLVGITVNGVTKELDRTYDIADAILTLRPGDTLCFETERGSETKTTSSYTLVWGDFRTLA